MIYIGIYADSISKKKINTCIIKYLKEINVEVDVNYIKTAGETLDIFDMYNKYNIIFICRNNKLTYIKKNSSNYPKKELKLTLVEFEIPLTSEQLKEILFSNNVQDCPPGIYKINNRKTLRLIPHEDIEYFDWNKDKSLVHLTNNETEEIFQSTKEIKKELHEDYFAECARGYIVNLFNIKRIDKIKQEITLKSGKTIPLNRKLFQNLINNLIRFVYGLKY